MSLLELKNIKKFFCDTERGKVLKAVNDVSLRIVPYENMGLVGESGCGKTTLARIILKLYSLDSGSMIFDGTDITHITQKRFRPLRRHIQMVFQDPYSSLDPRFTVRDILQEALYLDIKGYCSLTQREQRMISLLHDVQLKGDVLNYYPHEFSGGERQRIAIARALIVNPKLLILDESVSSLDVLIQDQILNLLKGLQERYSITYLFISHNLKVVKRLCQRIAVMYQGRIVEIGSRDQVFNNPLHNYTKDLLKAALEYQSTKRQDEIEISEKGILVEQDVGHFFMKNDT